MSAVPSPVACRWCAGAGADLAVAVVLDLGRQPPADYFPLRSDAGPDPLWALRMGVCGRCGLAQLLEDPGTVEQPLGREPQALLDQARQAVAAITAAGLGGRSFAEFDSPHGGSWRALLRAAGGDDRTGTGGPADVVVDVFGLMHDADQRAALQRRVDRLAPGGTLLLQFHSLASIVRQQQWNALRHGHFAYFSTTALTGMLAEAGLTVRRAWEFELYGGTVLLAATRAGDRPEDPTLHRLLEQDAAGGLGTAAGVAGLAPAADRTAAQLTTWLTRQRDEGTRVVGYGAASRAVPLLVHAGVDATLLPAVADGSPAKRDRRMPAGTIPIIAAEELRRRADDVVLLFVPDLLGEVRAAYPEVEARGARWAVSEPQPQLVEPLRGSAPRRPHRAS